MKTTYDSHQLKLHIEALKEDIVKISPFVVNQYFECNKVNEHRYNLFLDLSPKHKFKSPSIDDFKEYYSGYDWIKLRMYQRDTSFLIDLEYLEPTIPKHHKLFIYEEYLSNSNNICGITVRANYNVYKDNTDNILKKLDCFLNGLPRCAKEAIIEYKDSVWLKKVEDSIMELFEERYYHDYIKS